MFWNKLKALFRPQFIIVEVEVPKPVALENLTESLASLAHHPGFSALVGRLRLVRAQMQTRLSGNLAATLDEVRFLQAGIHWSGWLEQQINTQVYKTKLSSVDPSKEELAAFKEIHSSLELVGN